MQPDWCSDLGHDFGRVPTKLGGSASSAGRQRFLETALPFLVELVGQTSVTTPAIHIASIHMAAPLLKSRKAK